MTNSICILVYSTERKSFKIVTLILTFIIVKKSRKLHICVLMLNIKHHQWTVKFRNRSDKPKLNNLLRNAPTNWEPSRPTGFVTQHCLTELSDTYKLYFYSNRAYVPR